MNAVLSKLTADDFARWDDYVRSHDEGTVFHLSAWKSVIEESVGHQCHYYFVEQNNQIVGVLPLVESKSFLFGHKLGSLPFCVYGGVLADDDTVSTLLTNEAIRLADTLAVDHLEMRNREPLYDWPTKELYVTFRKEISTDDETNLMAIPRKQRAMIRKAIKLGLEYQIDEHLDNFFFAYESSVRNLGTPVFSRKYFRALKKHFGDDCEVLTVTKDGETICSVMSFYYKDEVLPYYGGGTVAARNLAGNDFMYWSLMSHAVAKGCRVFDYGRSKAGTGAYSFKKNWGFEPTPLHYQFYLVKDEALPDLNPLNPKYRYFIKAWQNLPLPIARVIGPGISKYLA